MTQRMLDEPIFEAPKKEPAAGRFKHLSVEEIVKKYSTERCELILSSIEDWFGVFNRHQLWYCNRHKLFFENSVRHVFYRKRYCKECQQEAALLELNIPENVIFIATKWRGKDKKYLFFCQRHSKVQLARWHDVVTKQRRFECCRIESVVGHPGYSTTFDVITKYIVNKVGE